MAAADINVITEVCSVLEYLEDRDELEAVEEVLTHVRWTNKKTNKVLVKSGGKTVEITARII